jgi:CheY-like chemotaxis protein
VSAKKLILLVDDEYAMRHILKKVLEQLGDFDFLEAQDGSEALALMTKFKPDLVFLDIAMPGITGIDALKQISKVKELKDIPVIMCTADSDQRTVQQVLMYGAVDYIIKPFTMDILKYKAKKWLFPYEMEE